MRPPGRSFGETVQVPARRHKARGTWAVLAIGLCSLVYGGSALARGDSGGDVGRVPASHAPTRPVLSSGAANSGAAVTGVADPAATAPGGTVVRSPITTAVQPSARPPLRLRLPRLGVSAPVIPVTLDRTGGLGVPEQPGVLGWWSEGARPSSGVGTVTIDGHVDSARFGVGVFAKLRDLRPGDKALLSDDAGRTTSYVVTGRRTFPKATLPTIDVFDQTVSERLVLITCGGRFDSLTRHYADNVVVYAALVRP